jgi:hypothetical protein
MISQPAKWNEIEQTQSPVWIKADGIALLAISVIAIGATILVHPIDNVPLIDDWVYAWSVEHFLKSGELRVLDWSSVYPLAQIIWAGLFAYIFDFSFFTLRVSTLVLAGLGLVAFYFTLRTLGVDWFLGVLGTLMLFFNPVFFVLSYSFMTDVPFVSVLNIALLFYVLWARQNSSTYLCLASTFAIVAFLIRLTGGVLPLVPLVYLLLHRIMSGERRDLPWPQILFLLLPFLGIGLTIWWIRDIHGPTSVYLQKADALNYFFSTKWWLSSRSWWTYFDGMVHALVHLGIVLSPMALVTLWSRSRGLLLLSSGLMILVTGLYLWHFGKLPKPPLRFGQTLSLEELGASRPLIHGTKYLQLELPTWTRQVLLGISLISALAIIAALLEAIRDRSRWLSRGGAVVFINGLLQFSAIEALWQYYDRYYLSLLPGLIVLLSSRRLKQNRLAKAVLVTGVVIFGAVSVSGTVDNFRFNRAVSNAREWLLSEKVAPWQIDAGYVLNGWWLYAHPDNLPPGARPETDVPFVTSKTRLPYRIANSPMPSYEVVRDLTWQSLWAASNKIYVLQKTPVVAVPRPSSNKTDSIRDSNLK